MKSKARSVRKEANGWGSNVWFGDGGNNPTNFQRVFYRTRREARRSNIADKFRSDGTGMRFNK